jgi:NADPH:quinone reductase-like Zn-dependent oxidoreductase
LVKASGVNFRDVLNVLDKYPGDAGPLGLEMSGIVSRVGSNVQTLAVGDAVYGLAKHFFLTFVVTSEHNVAKMPMSVLFAEAAGLPTVMATTYHALHNIAKVKKGDRVLIQAAAGGVGLSAIQMANAKGAIVFGTASTPKHPFLEQFGGVDNLLNSRSLGFAEELMKLTDNKGVDMFLNSLAGDFLDKTREVMAKNGRFVEIGKTGIRTAEVVRTLRPDVLYAHFDLLNLFEEDPVRMKHVLVALGNDLSSGALRPLPVTTATNSAEDAAQAFRMMSQGRHIGKIVLTQKVSLHSHVSVAPVFRPLKEAEPAGSYLITGGYGGLGFRVAEWLSSTKGIRNVILVGQRDLTEDAAGHVAQLEKQGVSVHCGQSDSSCLGEMLQVVRGLPPSFPPLKGIVHAAGILDDGIVAEMTWDRMVCVMKPKLEGATAITLLVAFLPTKLDIVVFFSSITSLTASWESIVWAYQVVSLFGALRVSILAFQSRISRR